MTLTEKVKKLFDSEKAGGLILVVTTILSLALANSPWQTGIFGIWIWVVTVSFIGLTMG